MPTDPVPPETAFSKGLALDHLNPPDIQQFVRGLPRRLDESLGKLSERAEVDQVVGLLTEIVDQLDELIDDLAGSGFALDTNLQVALADWSHQANRSSDLGNVRRRLDRAAVEAARRLAGIPNKGWSSSDQLLDDVRASIGRIAPLVRTIDRDVMAANSRVGGPPGSSHEKAE